MKPKDKSRDSSLGDYLIEAIQELDVYPVHTEIYNEDEDDEIILFKEDIEIPLLSARS